MDEIMDLYDRNRQITKNTYIRGSAQPKGFFRLVVHVCIFNSKGELLIQQRTYNKKMPGLWDVTCGGAVSTKESSSQGAQRELSEDERPERKTRSQTKGKAREKRVKVRLCDGMTHSCLT